MTQLEFNFNQRKEQTAVEWLVKEFNLESYKASVDFAL
jgi:hypothetical protein